MDRVEKGRELVTALESQEWVRAAKLARELSRDLDAKLAAESRMSREFRMRMSLEGIPEELRDESWDSGIPKVEFRSSR